MYSITFASTTSLLERLTARAGFDGHIGSSLNALFSVYLMFCFPPILVPLRETLVRLYRQRHFMMGLVASPPSDIRAILNESTQPFIAQGQVMLSSRGKKLPACVALCRLKRGERDGWRAVRGEIEV